MTERAKLLRTLVVEQPLKRVVRHGSVLITEFLALHAQVVLGRPHAHRRHLWHLVSATDFHVAWDLLALGCDVVLDGFPR